MLNLSKKRKPLPAVSAFIQSLDALRDIGADFHHRGWSLGTSSNYSLLLSQNPFRLLITASGKDKGHLSRDDFVIVDQNGQLTDTPRPGFAPSAETLLHVSAVQHAGAGAVLHTHSPWATILSDHFFDQGAVIFDGYEMLKGLDGITTHRTTLPFPILDNTQDIPALAATLNTRLAESNHPFRYGFLLRKHGLYTWGKTLADARRHTEVLEFLLQVLAHTHTLIPPTS